MRNGTKYLKFQAKLGEIVQGETKLSGTREIHPKLNKAKSEITLFSHKLGEANHSYRASLFRQIQNICQLAPRIGTSVNQNDST